MTEQKYINPHKYYPLIKHTKRFVLRFETWYYEYPYENNSIPNFSDKRVKRQISIDEFDTRDEMNEYCELYKEMYKHTPQPIEVFTQWWNKDTKQYVNPGKIHRYDINVCKIDPHVDFINGEARYWGYVMIDFDNEEIIGTYHDIPELFLNYKKNLGLYDKLFRKENEITNDYVWDEGEWEGWLQYRWGNHLNAIETEDELNRKRELRKLNKKIKIESEIEEATEEDLKQYVSNYESVHTTNDQEVEFSEDTINYLETTQQMQKIIDTAIEKDVDYFSVNESEWSSKNPWSDIKPVTILTDEEKKIIEEDWDEDDLLDESNYQEEFNEWLKQKYIDEDNAKFKDEDPWF